MKKSSNYFLFFFLRQPHQYNEQIHDNANALQTHPSTESNSPNNPLNEHGDNIIDRVSTETDVNELDKIFCDKNANSTTSDNDDSRSIPGIENSETIADNITNDNRKDSNSLQTSNTENANLDSNVFSDVDPHQQHQEVCFKWILWLFFSSFSFVLKLKTQSIR